MASCPEGFTSGKAAGAPSSFNITTSVVCSLFGQSHPVCKVFDEIIPNLCSSLLLGGITIPGKLGARLKATLQALGYLDNLPDEDIDTEEFCQNYNPDNNQIEDITWQDVFLAFTGCFNDELLRKVTNTLAYEKFFQVCTCKKNKDDEVDVIPPNPITPIPDDTLCADYFQSFADSIPAQNADRADSYQACRDSYGAGFLDAFESYSLACSLDSTPPLEVNDGNTLGVSCDCKVSVRVARKIHYNTQLITDLIANDPDFQVLPLSDLLEYLASQSLSQYGLCNESTITGLCFRSECIDRSPQPDPELIPPEQLPDDPGFSICDFFPDAPDCAPCPECPPPGDDCGTIQDSFELDSDCESERQQIYVDFSIAGLRDGWFT